MKKVFLSLCIISLLQHATPTTSSAHTSLSITLGNPARTRSLQSSLKKTYTALTNLPETITPLLPTANTVQKLFLTAALIGIGYQCCKYGLAKANDTINLYPLSDDSPEDKKKRNQSRWFALSSASFLIIGTGILSLAQRIANFAYGQ